MEHFIEALRAAAASCDAKDLKTVFDYIIELAKEEYQAGALDVLEYASIVDEYADTLKLKNVVNYI